MQYSFFVAHFLGYAAIALNQLTVSPAILFKSEASFATIGKVGMKAGTRVKRVMSRIRDDLSYQENRCNPITLLNLKSTEVLC